MIIFREALFLIQRNGLFGERRGLISKTAIETPHSCRKSARLFLQPDRFKKPFLTAIYP
jgi:hypothetical protein